ncbi:hypothetical protein PMAYCL1PPCAC_05845, partial [Pristionchus mayeri]
MYSQSSKHIDPSDYGTHVGYMIVVSVVEISLSVWYLFVFREFFDYLKDRSRELSDDTTLL